MPEATIDCTASTNKLNHAHNLAKTKATKNSNYFMWNEEKISLSCHFVAHTQVFKCTLLSYLSVVPLCYIYNHFVSFLFLCFAEYFCDFTTALGDLALKIKQTCNSFLDGGKYLFKTPFAHESFLCKKDENAILHQFSFILF